ncbi:unnamed protein product [Amoebophrya sp. A25]|nr:unnamed protein product [Amoebophrya sp. A25]|eukprot:GSA25T00012330001.1
MASSGATDISSFGLGTEKSRWTLDNYFKPLVKREKLTAEEALEERADLEAGFDLKRHALACMRHGTTKIEDKLQQAADDDDAQGDESSGDDDSDSCDAAKCDVDDNEGESAGSGDDDGEKVVEGSGIDNSVVDEDNEKSGTQKAADELQGGRRINGKDEVMESGDAGRKENDLGDEMDENGTSEDDTSSVDKKEISGNSDGAFSDESVEDDTSSSEDEIPQDDRSDDDPSEDTTSSDEMSEEDDIWDFEPTGPSHPGPIDDPTLGLAVARMWDDGHPVRFVADEEIDYVQREAMLDSDDEDEEDEPLGYDLMEGSKYYVPPATKEIPLSLWRKLAISGTSRELFNEVDMLNLGLKQSRLDKGSGSNMRQEEREEEDRQCAEFLEGIFLKRPVSSCSSDTAGLRVRSQKRSGETTSKQLDRTSRRQQVKDELDSFSRDRGALAATPATSAAIKQEASSPKKEQCSEKIFTGKISSTVAANGVASSSCSGKSGYRSCIKPLFPEPETEESDDCGGCQGFEKFMLAAYKRFARAKRHENASKKELLEEDDGDSDSDEADADVPHLISAQSTQSHATSFACSASSSKFGRTKVAPQPESNTPQLNEQLQPQRESRQGSPRTKIVRTDAQYASATESRKVTVSTQLEMMLGGGGEAREVGEEVSAPSDGVASGGPTRSNRDRDLLGLGTIDERNSKTIMSQFLTDQMEKCRAWHRDSRNVHTPARSCCLSNSFASGADYSRGLELTGRKEFPGCFLLLTPQNTRMLCTFLKDNLVEGIGSILLGVEPANELQATLLRVRQKLLTDGYLYPENLKPICQTRPMTVKGDLSDGRKRSAVRRDETEAEPQGSCAISQKVARLQPHVDDPAALRKASALLLRKKAGHASASLLSSDTDASLYSDDGDSSASEDGQQGPGPSDPRDALPSVPPAVDSDSSGSDSDDSEASFSEDSDEDPLETAEAQGVSYFVNDNGKSRDADNPEEDHGAEDACDADSEEHDENDDNEAMPFLEEKDPERTFHCQWSSSKKRGTNNNARFYIDEYEEAVQLLKDGRLSEHDAQEAARLDACVFRNALDQMPGVGKEEANSGQDNISWQDNYQRWMLGSTVGGGDGDASCHEKECFPAAEYADELQVALDAAIEVAEVDAQEEEKARGEEDAMDYESDDDESDAADDDVDPFERQLHELAKENRASVEVAQAMLLPKVSRFDETIDKALAKGRVAGHGQGRGDDAKASSRSNKP